MSVFNSVNLRRDVSDENLIAEKPIAKRKDEKNIRQHYVVVLEGAPVSRPAHTIVHVDTLAMLSPPGFAIFTNGAQSRFWDN
jgi:hypothetical protein